MSPRHSAYKTLASLPSGSVVGTSSVRRSAQIARLHPHLRFKDVRGNVGTRLGKLDDLEGEYACLILAAAGLERMGLGDRITSLLTSKTEGGGMLHAVGQGALGVEIREDDERVRDVLKGLECKKTALACLSERSLLRTLEGGCSVPIGVETEWQTESRLSLTAMVVSLDGKEAVEDTLVEMVETEAHADEFGRQIARKLIEGGAEQILKKITLNRDLVNA
jgi:hydroxymethylbilane synthase